MERAINFKEEEKVEGCNSRQLEEAEEEEEDVDEALSLCDLPVNLIKEENQPSSEDKQESQAFQTGEDFDFGSRGGFHSTEPEMCAADEVFFKGQILPLRLSVSSDSGSTGLRNDSLNPSRCISRSESMDRGSVSRLASLSSRSSSTGSHFSSSSTSSMTNTTKNSRSKPIRLISNNFHTHPSPKPQIRVSKTRAVNFSSRNQKSSVWDFFRLSLVRAPEIELQDLKVRSSNNNANRISSASRNSSCSSSNSSSSIKNNNSTAASKNLNCSSTNVVKNQQELMTKDFPEKRLTTGLFSGCKCSASAVDTVPLNNVVIIKSSKGEKKMHAVEEKLQELKIKKKLKEKEKEKQQGKQALSRHRTFEWLKELSHASYVDEA